MLAPRTALVNPLPASIELLPNQIPTIEQLTNLLPAGTRVYLADIGRPGTDTEMLAAARRLRDVGCIPVPHLAARRVKSREDLKAHIGRLTELAGVSDVLVIGGGVAEPAGPYASTMELLETGLLDRFGIEDIAVAGHPEGCPHVSEASAIEALKKKQAFADRTGARLRIVTQFGFNAARAMAWVGGLEKIGVDIPVHIGVAGPTKLPTLIKYATLCGIGNSVAMLKSSAGAFVSLAIGYSPEAFVMLIEQELAAVARPAISQMHVFPFGGLEKSSSWLRDRGSW